MISAALGLGALSAALAATSGSRTKSPKLSKVTFESQMILGDYSGLIRKGYVVPFAHWLARRFAEEIEKAALTPGQYVRGSNFSTKVQLTGVTGFSGSRFKLRHGGAIARGPNVFPHFSQEGTRINVEWPSEGVFKHWMKVTNPIPGVFPDFGVKAEGIFMEKLIFQLELLSKEMERRDRADGGPP